MAPPPSAELPLAERLAKLVKTLQFAWFIGHATLIFCFFRYLLSWLWLSYYTTWARLSYRTTFLAAAATYGIVVYKTFRARQKSKARQPGLVGHLTDENVQYLLLALLWLFSPQYPLAMLPYGIYSVFHVLTYTRTNLLPTLVPQKKAARSAAASPSGKSSVLQHPIAESIGSFVKQYYDTSMSVVAFLEIALWGRLFISAIMFKNWSWTLILFYTVFLRARFAQSSHVQSQFSAFELCGDNLVGAQGTHPLVRQGWEGAKNGLRQLYRLTELNQYVNGAAAPKKTS